MRRSAALPLSTAAQRADPLEGDDFLRPPGEGDGFFLLDYGASPAPNPGVLSPCRESTQRGTKTYGFGIPCFIGLSDTLEVSSH